MSQSLDSAAQAAQQNSEAVGVFVIGIKVLGLVGIFSAGLLGAACIAAFDPPTSRKQLFTQAAVAGVGSLFFGPVVLATVQHFSTWIVWTSLNMEQSISYAAPVYLVTGGLAWGVFGALARLRKLISERGAQAVAKRMGVDTSTPSEEKPQ